MLPPNLKSVVNYIQKTIEKAASAAEKRQESQDKRQAEIAAAIQSITDEFKAYQSKQEANEPQKRRRENQTIGALIAAAVFTFILDGLSGCQLIEMRKAYEPVKTAADAATRQAVVAEKTLSQLESPYVFPSPPFFGGVETPNAPPKVRFFAKNYGRTPAIIKLGTATVEQDGKQTGWIELFRGTIILSSGEEKEIPLRGTGTFQPFPKRIEAPHPNTHRVPILNVVFNYYDVFGNSYLSSSSYMEIVEGTFQEVDGPNYVRQPQK